jgi:hypothetical protein
MSTIQRRTLPMISTQRSIKNFPNLWKDYSVARDVIERIKSYDSFRMDQMWSRMCI